MRRRTAQAPSAGPPSSPIRRRAGEPADGGIDVEVPGDQVLGTGPSLKFGEDALPGALALPAAEQVLRRAHGPYSAGMSHHGMPEPYAVDQLPPGP